MSLLGSHCLGCQLSNYHRLNAIVLDEQVLTGVAAGGDGGPVLSGRVGDCCGGHAGVPHMHEHGGGGHGGMGSGGLHALNASSARQQHFSSMGASLDSDAAVAGGGGFSPRAGGGGGPDAFKHGYAKASSIVPYTPLRRGGDEPAASDQLPEVNA